MRLNLFRSIVLFLTDALLCAMPERPWLDLVFVFEPRVFVVSHRLATQTQSGVYDAFYRASRLYLWQSCMKQRN